MQFTIYINQQFMLDNELNMQECALVDYLTKAATWAASMAEDGETYYLLRRPKILDDMPCLGSDRTLRRAIKNLQDKGIICRSKKDWSWVKLTSKCKTYNQRQDKLATHRPKVATAPAKSGQHHRPKVATYYDTSHHDTNTKEKRRAKRATQVPKDFKPTEKHLFMAKEVGVNAYKEKDKFIDYYLSTGRTMKNWDAAFRNWLRKASEYQQPQQQARDRNVTTADDFFS